MANDDCSKTVLVVVIGIPDFSFFSPQGEGENGASSEAAEKPIFYLNVVFKN